MKKFLLSAAVYAIATPGLAADIPLPMEPIPEVIVAPAYSWTGFYVGVHAGGIWGDQDRDGIDCGSITNIIVESDLIAEEASCEDAVVSDDQIIPGGAVSPSFPGSLPTFELGGDFIGLTGGDDGDDDDFGFLGGGQIGANWQAGFFVLGFEADISAIINDDDDDSGDESSFEFFSAGPDPLGDFVGEGFVASEADLNWLATVRGRVGAAFGPESRFLLYGTGGVAFAGIDSSLSGRFEHALLGDVCDGCFFEDDDNHDGIEVGWTVGVGGEWAATNRVSLGLEYLFVNFDEQDRTITFVGDQVIDSRAMFDINDSVDFDQNIIRAKLNVKLGG